FLYAFEMDRERKQAIEALQAMGSPAVPLLLQVARGTYPTPDLSALKSSGFWQTVSWALSRLFSPNGQVILARQRAIWTLGKIEAFNFIDPLMGFYQTDPVCWVRGGIGGLVVDMKDIRGLPVLIAVLAVHNRGGGGKFRVDLKVFLGDWRDPRAVEP